MFGGLINASSLSLAENIENDVVSINEVKKDVNNYDNASVKTETAISTEENVETTNTDVIDNGSNVVMTNAENDNNSASNADDKVVIAQYEVNKTNDEKKTQIAEKNDGNAGAVTNISSKQVKILGTNGENNFVNYYNIGMDLYFSTGGNVFSGITGVDSYNAGNLFYSLGMNTTFSWKIRNELHMFVGVGYRSDWFGIVTAGVSKGKMSPSLGFYGIFGMKVVVSKSFSVEPYINFGGFLLNTGKVYYNYSERTGLWRKESAGAKAVGMRTAIGADFILFRFLMIGLQLQYSIFSRNPLNQALVRLGHDGASLSQNRWQHHLAIVGRIGLRFDTLYLTL